MNGEWPLATGWKVRNSLSEAVANVWGSGVLAVTVAVIIASAMGVAVSVDLDAAHRIVADEQAYLDSGGDLIVARPTAEGALLDASRCARISEVAGVKTAFALDVHAGEAAMVGRQEVVQTVVLATHGVSDLLGIDHLATDQAVASTTVADRWQWSVGSRFQFAEGNENTRALPRHVMSVAAITNLGLLSEGASTGILMTRAATGGAQSCFVQAEAAYMEDVMALVPALLGETQAEMVQVAFRVPPSSYGQDPAQEFETRSTRWIGAAVGLMAGLVWSIVAWTRRGRAALYSSIGVPSSGGVLIRWGEGLVVVTIGLVWGALLGCAAAAGLLGVAPTLAITMGTQHLVIALATGATVVVITGLFSPPTLAMLKDR